MPLSPGLKSLPTSGQSYRTFDAENLRAGLSPVETRHQAMLKFGGVEAIRQDYRTDRGLVVMREFVAGCAL